MRDESLLEEMRAAVSGDRKRAELRRSQAVEHHDVESPIPPPQPGPQPTPEEDAPERRSLFRRLFSS